MMGLPPFEKHCGLDSFAPGRRTAFRTLVLLLLLWLSIIITIILLFFVICIQVLTITYILAVNHISSTYNGAVILWFQCLL